MSLHLRRCRECETCGTKCYLPLEWDDYRVLQCASCRDDGEYRITDDADITPEDLVEAEGVAS